MSTNICVKCNRTFKAKTALKRYCSIECRDIFNRYSKNKKCGCGSLIANNSNQCSKCMIRNRDLNGDKNGRWKGGTSEGFQMNIYRQILIDNGINIEFCSNCGNKHPKIHIHHIDGNHQNNNLKNLTSLCPSCHLKSHRSNGETKKCLICGKTKYFNQSKLNRVKNYYCSKLCYNKHKSQLMKGNTIRKDKLTQVNNGKD